MTTEAPKPQVRRVARKTPAERRAFMRAAAEGGLVADSSKSIGYALNWGDASRPACVAGFALRHGFADSWVYAMLREMKACARARAHAFISRSIAYTQESAKPWRRAKPATHAGRLASPQFRA